MAFFPRDHPRNFCWNNTQQRAFDLVWVIVLELAIDNQRFGQYCSSGDVYNGTSLGPKLPVLHWLDSQIMEMIVL